MGNNTSAGQSVPEKRFRAGAVVEEARFARQPINHDLPEVQRAETQCKELLGKLIGQVYVCLYFARHGCPCGHYTDPRRLCRSAPGP